LVVDSRAPCSGEGYLPRNLCIGAKKCTCWVEYLLGIPRNPNVKRKKVKAAVVGAKVHNRKRRLTIKTESWRKTMGFAKVDKG
jgi:hypothetical protein